MVTFRVTGSQGCRRAVIDRQEANMFHLKAWVCALAIVLLGGCSAVGGAVDIAFKLGHGLGELGVASTRHAVNAAKGGIEVAKGSLELAGGTVKLLDQSHQTGHNTRMRDLEFEQAADATRR